MQLEGYSGTPAVPRIKGTNSAAGTYELPRKGTAVKVLSGVTTTALTFLALTSFSSAQPATQEAPRRVQRSGCGHGVVSSLRAELRNSRIR